MKMEKMEKSDEKLLRMLESSDKGAALGDSFKSEVVRLILVKSDDDEELKPSGRAICTLCKSILSANDGGHIARHVNIRCEKRRAISEPPTELAERNEGENSEEPPLKQRKLTEFSQRKFTKEQTSKISNALAKHALLTGKSFNYISGTAMKTLLIEVKNATGSGMFGSEASNQIPSRPTVQKVAMAMSDRLISRAFEPLKPFAGKRVNLIVDHGKIVVKYLSVFTSFLDETFSLKVIPIGITDIDDKDSFDWDLVHSLSVSGLLAINHYSSEFEDYHYGAVLLSPRTKKMTSFSSFERERAIDFFSGCLPQDSQILLTSSSVVVPDFIREMSDQTGDTPKHNELKRYMDEFVDMSSPETIEEFWRRKQLDFPALYQVAARILSIVPSESACETTFSTAAYLLDKRRSRLQYTTAEKIVLGCQIAAKFPEWIN